MNYDEQLKEAKVLLQQAQDALEHLENNPPVGQWKPKGKWFVADSGTTFEAHNNEHRQDFGNSFLTMQQAQKASPQMRRHNKLLAYVAEFDDGWEPDFGDRNQYKHFIFYAHHAREWRSTFDTRTENPDIVYMSFECAEGLQAKLNTGEVIL